MKLQYQLVRIFCWCICISISLTGLFSALQILYPSCTLLLIINNIVICIATSSIIVFIQSCVSYYVSKREAILEFYKDAFLLEQSIINSKYYLSGTKIIEPEKSREQCAIILREFYTNLKYSYNKIKFPTKMNCLYKALYQLFNLYCNEMAFYKHLESASEDGIIIKEQLEDSSLSEDQKDEMVLNVNNKLQNAIDKLVNNYNSPERLHKSSEMFLTIENYLFHKQSE